MRRKTKRNLIIGAFAALVIAIGVLTYFDVKQNTTIHAYLEGYRQLQLLSGTGDYGSTHVHADFQVYVNGKQIDFTRTEYQLKHALVHLEEPAVAPYLIHKHATGITYGMFFTTIGVDITECLTINGKEFCDINGRTVKYYLNGQITPDLYHAQINDLDKVLISYGSESLDELQMQLASVGDRAKVQSDKE